MKTATAVGDYYDFGLASDSNWIIAVGDATSHELKAVTVKTTMKSLFRTFSSELKPAVLLRQFSRILKEMNLPSLLLALTVLKFNDHKLKISAPVCQLG